MIDFLRGMLVVGTGLVFLSTLLVVSANHWGLDVEISRDAVGIAAVGLFAATAGIFPGRARIFGAGVAVGILFVLLRG